MDSANPAPSADDPKCGASKAAETDSNVTPSPSAIMARRVFEHLDTIHKLQSNIARAHRNLEKVDLEIDSHFEAKKSEEKLPTESHSQPKHSQKPSTSAGTQNSDKSSFEMRETFLDRQKGVNEVMLELSELSLALNAIHDLKQDFQPSRPSSDKLKAKE
ncbi:hypothetical protein O181_045402 [Austropuccinia psidii MF-1]|uniref:Uncharacterized protein n=1 Tax=Austropuccinia psidii MF-1 TaxID=1389203 RepID=A0A9Q3DPB7_9BASI|nr:hypothetical protein [Austropuccinia psidii MF-1]